MVHPPSKNTIGAEGASYGERAAGEPFGKSALASEAAYKEGGTGLQRVVYFVAGAISRA